MGYTNGVENYPVTWMDEAKESLHTLLISSLSMI